MSPLAEDTSPTAPDHEWRCNGCTFKSPHYGVAAQHVRESFGSSFPHLCYERKIGDADGQPRRRIVLYANGALKTQIAPQRRSRKKKAEPVGA